MQQRVTRQRIAVSDVMRSESNFRTSQEVHELLRQSGHSIGLATVYRTLQAMEAAGQIDSVRSPEGEVMYRSCTKPGHHHHLICRTCGRSQEFSIDALEAALGRMAEQAGFSRLTHNIEVFGDCRMCSQETHD